MKNNFLFILLLCNLCLARDPFLLAPAAVPVNTGSTGKPIVSEYRNVTLNYLDVEAAAEILEKLYPDAVVTAEKNNNTLLVGMNDQTRQILIAVQNIDRPPRSVKLKIHILEITTNDLNQLGIDWNFSSEGLRLGRTTQEVQATLRALAGNGQTKILAAPNLVTLTGKEAVIHIGDRLPYALPVQQNNTTHWQIQYIDSGINMSFLPLPAAPEEIYLQLKPQISAIKYWKQTPGGEFPVLSTRQIETNLLLKNGESFVLAGLYNEETRESVQKVPFLGDIPLLNIFFKSTIQENVASDIIFVITAEEV